MQALVGSALALTAPSPLTKQRDYEAFVAGPVGGVTDRYGTVDEYRYGQQYLKALRMPTNVDDPAIDDFGIQQEGTITLELVAPENDEANIATRLFALQDVARNLTVDVELVSRVYREDGTFAEFVVGRRGVIKVVRRQANVLVFEVSDVNRSVLEVPWPRLKFTTTDFPKLYADHVGRYVPEFVGIARKVPLTYVDNTPGAYRFIVGRLVYGQGAVLTVYRNGRFVPAAEYSVDVVVVTGVSYLRITFVKEQADYGDGITLYELTADVRGDGSRIPSDETRRILLELGESVDTTSFDAAATYGSANGMFGDYRYVEQRNVSAIVEDHMPIARGVLRKTAGGAWAIWQDRPREISQVLDASNDLLEVDSFERPELKKTMTLEYLPLATSDVNEWSGKLSRTTSGVAGEKTWSNPYISDHVTADRFICYQTKREASRATAKGGIHGVQLAAGDLVAVKSNVAWQGWKTFAAPQVSRPTDRVDVSLLLYDEAIHTYDPSPLLADARNGYAPDLSLTPPAAPTGVLVVSQIVITNGDGSQSVQAVIRATPPGVFSTLWAIISDDASNEIYVGQLILTGGNYDATIVGMRPNRPHKVVAWAVSAGGVQGLTSDPPVPLTTLDFSIKPVPPASITAAQRQSFEVIIAWPSALAIAGQPPVASYVVFEKAGAAAYVEIARTADSQLVRHVTNNITYQYKVRTVDAAKNESDDSTSATITPLAKVNDSYIVTQGVSGPSIANNSINQDRSYTGTGSTSITLGVAPNGADFVLDVFGYFPGLDKGGSSARPIWLCVPPAKGASPDASAFRIENGDAGSGATVHVDWRKVNS